MSDLTATHCGCEANNNSCCGSFLWILILLFCCNGNHDGCGCGNGILGGMNSGCGCDSIIWIILLLCFCGNNNSCC
ncbi:MAG: chorion class high-cysteine HCB protein 13 [Lachnospiraceae bacterium]|nr:chorion class high-cysteine HCB protein 13 [Lachnospiraceae bacterium]